MFQCYSISTIVSEVTKKFTLLQTPEYSLRSDGTS